MHLQGGALFSRHDVVTQLLAELAASLFKSFKQAFDITSQYNFYFLCFVPLFDVDCAMNNMIFTSNLLGSTVL